MNLINICIEDLSPIDILYLLIGLALIGFMIFGKKSRY
jgi:hypothetical protein